MLPDQTPTRPTGRSTTRRTALAVLLVGAVLCGLAALGGGSAGAEPSTTAPDPATSLQPSSTGPTPSEDPGKTPSDDAAPSNGPSSSPSSTPSTATTAEPPVSPTTPATTSRPVEGVTLRWGLTNESSNRAFAPGTFNFFSAGRAADPGRGGVTLPQGGWRQSEGTVSVQKWDGSTWQPATWAGLGTDSAGIALGAPTAGTFSNHTFLFTAGTGTVDRAGGDAHVSWQGDVTVLYYSGMSFFYLSDPVLDVVDGVGRLTGTLSGYASSQADASLWQAVAPRQVTLAELPSVDLSDEHGTVALPTYRGVVVSGVQQSITGPDTGSFPQSWIDFASLLGTAAFWYSSGGSTDAFKVALPITVGFDDTVTAARPSAASTTRAATVRNSAKPLPTPTSTEPTSTSPAPATTQTAVPDVAAEADGSVDAPPGGAVPPAADGLVDVPRPATALRSTAAPTALVDASARLWWLGGGLLLAAALLLLVPSGHRGPTPTP